MKDFEMTGSRSVWKQLVLVILLGITFSSAAPNPAQYYEDIPLDSLQYRPILIDDYDYDYAIDGKSVADPATEIRQTTQQRPLVRVWNNLVRNMRLNMPHISWNVTNPLSNLFNNTSTNVMEPAQPNANLNQDTNPKTKQKSSTKKNKKKLITPQKEQLPHLIEISEKPQEYLTSADEEDMFFLDPITNDYYVVKRVSSSTFKSNKNQVKVPSESVNVVEIPSSSLKPSPVTLTTQRPTIETQVIKLQSTTESAHIEEHEISVSSSLKPNKVQLTNESANTEEPVEALSMEEEESSKPDEDVQVVEEIEDTPDTLVVEPESKPAITVDKGDNDTLRNYIGSFMRDDQLNMERQQAANPMREKQERPKPRRVLYILRGLQ